MQFYAGPPVHFLSGVDSLAVLLIVGYGLGLLFTLRTHREVFSGAERAEAGEAPWPIGLALATLTGVTVLVALVSEIFVESVQKAAETFGMTPPSSASSLWRWSAVRLRWPRRLPARARTGST
jgi:Ca2+/H+ antiporter